MGMAASQARLLTITARMHDIEYQAQSIQNAKIALATQSDQVYQEYVAALDEQTLTVKDWQGNTIAATFSNLCGINAVDSNYQYALIDEKGRLIVDRNIAEQYEKYMGMTGDKGDAYGFALFMLGATDEKFDNNNIKDDYEYELSVFNTVLYGTDPMNLISENERNSAAYKKEVEEVRNKYKMQEAGSSAQDKDLYDLLKQLEEQYNKKKEYTEGKRAEYSEDELMALKEKYLYQLNKRYSKELYTEVNCTELGYNEDKFNYYVTIFKEIQENGGSCVSIANCVSVSDYDGFDGDAASDGDWLRDMIQAGKITVEHVNTDKKNGRVTLSSTSVPSDSVLEYTATSTVDSAKLAKVQAEYEHKTKELDRKDKKFDLDLSKLDTQRTALKTEYESVKKVISENIDRTFGIFS